MHLALERWTRASTYSYMARRKRVGESKSGREGSILGSGAFGGVYDRQVYWA
jgi:hypothetical protein